jgi:hypothetical protein
MEEQTIGSTHSKLSHLINVSLQLNFPTALPLRVQPQNILDRRLAESHSQSACCGETEDMLRPA